MAEINYPLLKEMIDCVSREISFRYAVYPNRIKVGKMTQEQAEKEIHLMQLIRNSLKKIYDNQASETVQQAFSILRIIKTNKMNTGGKMVKRFISIGIKDKYFLFNPDTIQGFVYDKGHLYLYTQFYSIELEEVEPDLADKLQAVIVGKNPDIVDAAKNDAIKDHEERLARLEKMHFTQVGE